MPAPLDDDPCDDDPLVSPARYPGPRAPGSGMLVEGRFERLTPPELRRLAQPPYDDRVLVAAVGANASPAVLHRKLRRHGVRDRVPFLAATLTGVAVAHSAHVSVPGYVPAAPYVATGVSTPVMASLLDAEQVDCLDRTEPNYVRRTLCADAFELRLDGGGRPGDFDLYDGRWGVLAPPGGTPIALTGQVDLHTYLAAHWPAYTDLLGTERDPESAVLALGQDAALRARVREAWHANGWATGSGLEAG
ncbi:MAG TPA: hypothetical protein VNP20_22720 [Nocardioidaceae bacterium]|nr:hypothetical protein [Nocardioidaceae bacterium]